MLMGRPVPDNDKAGQRNSATASHWDHSSHAEFFAYYAEASQSEATVRRFRAIRDAILRVLAQRAPAPRSLDVADIGCGAGTQSFLWAELGHRVCGLDVNEPLLELARKRAEGLGYAIDFRVGLATDPPFQDESMDVYLAIELLEHVADWESCLNAAARTLRPGGLLFLSTTNKLCPIQEEFNLPFYSWYPARWKHYFERLASTTRPELANYAKYPAVNWFSFYELREALTAKGFHCLDRFDLIDTAAKGKLAKFVVRNLLPLPILRWWAHVCTPGTRLLAVKQHAPDQQTVATAQAFC